MTTVVNSEDSALTALFSCSERIMVLTDAGVSAASGLPTYRGAGGVYTDAEILALHNADALPGSLGALWAFYGPARELVASVEPNPAHRAIARWQLGALGQGRGFTLVPRT